MQTKNYHVQGDDKRTRVEPGYWTANGTGVTLEVGVAIVFASVVRTGVGTYIAVLKDTHHKLLSAKVTLGAPTPGTTVRAVLGAATYSGIQTGAGHVTQVQVLLLDQAGALADPSQSTRVYLKLVYSDHVDSGAAHPANLGIATPPFGVYSPEYSPEYS